MADSSQKSGGRSKRPWWYTVVVLLAFGAIWLAQQKGWIDSSETGDQTADTSTERPTGSPTSYPSGSDQDGGGSSDTPRRLPEASSIPDTGAGGSSSSLPSTNVYEADRVAELFARGQESDEQITVSGEVVHILPDDLEGHKHQRFLVLVDPREDLTLLVAHNIDLAPRVPIEKGDFVRMHGEYEWSDRGGVIHWTHHNPAGVRGRHPAGWIDHAGERYE